MESADDREHFPDMSMRHVAPSVRRNYRDALDERKTLILEVQHLATNSRRTGERARRVQMIATALVLLLAMAVVVLAVYAFNFEVTSDLTVWTSISATIFATLGAALAFTGSRYSSQRIDAVETEMLMRELNESWRWIDNLQQENEELRAALADPSRGSRDGADRHE